MSLSFFDFQNNSVVAKRARRKAFRTRMIRAYAATVANTETVSATANGGQPVTYMIDSGATYTILASTTAASIGFDTSNPTRQQGVTTVTGQTQADVFSVSFKINDTPAFQTEILVMESAFNLLSTEDLSKAYRVTLHPQGTGFDLFPLGSGGGVPSGITPTTPTPAPAPTSPAPQQQQVTAVPKTGNVLVDLVRQLYQMLCNTTPKIPVICNNPNIFMAFLIIGTIAMLMLIMKGMVGGG